MPCQRTSKMLKLYLRVVMRGVPSLDVMEMKVQTAMHLQRQAWKYRWEEKLKPLNLISYVLIRGTMKHSIFGLGKTRSFQNSSNLTKRMISRPETRSSMVLHTAIQLSRTEAWQTLYSVDGMIRSTASHSQLQQEWRLSIWDSVQH